MPWLHNNCQNQGHPTGDQYVMLQHYINCNRSEPQKLYCSGFVGRFVLTWPKKIDLCRVKHHDHMQSMLRTVLAMLAVLSLLSVAASTSVEVRWGLEENGSELARWSAGRPPRAPPWRALVAVEMQLASPPDPNLGV